MADSTSSSSSLGTANIRAGSPAPDRAGPARATGAGSVSSPSTAGLLLVISGPSGVGKTTITHQIEERLGGIFSVSVTTRPKTAADVEGRDYYFISDEQFRAKRDAGDLLEWAEVFGKYHYGTPREPVERHLAAGKLVILEIDVQGALQVKRAMPDAFMMFILPPTDEELLQRLRRRGREGEQAIQRRFAEAKKEIQTAQSSNAYDAFLVNDRLEEMVNKACAIINERRQSHSARRPGHPSQ